MGLDDTTQWVGDTILGLGHTIQRVGDLIHRVRNTVQWSYNSTIIPPTKPMNGTINFTHNYRQNRDMQNTTWLPLHTLR